MKPSNCQHLPVVTDWSQGYRTGHTLQKTHVQKRGPYCCLWVLWVPKQTRTTKVPRATKAAIDKVLQAMEISL